MALIDKKVSEAYSGRDISSLSNRPNEDGIDGEELKARFDQLGKEVIPKYNQVIDILVAGNIEEIMSAGQGINVIDVYDTYLEFITAHPTGNINDIYGVRVAPNIQTYIWSVASSVWKEFALIGDKDKIGNLVYTENNYITVGEEVTDSLDKLDIALKDVDDAKQPTLVSGTNIKTINGNSVLGGGDIPTMLPKNWIINGMFDVWQRGTSQTLSSYGSVDRWLNGHSVSTKTVTREAFVVGQTTVPNNPKYYLRTVVVSSNTADAYVGAQHRIEDVSKLAGKTVALSFWAKANANKSVSIKFIQRFGTGGSADVDGIGIQKFALTTEWQRFTKVVTLPSVVGKSIDADSYLQLVITFDAGSNLNAMTDSLGNQSGTFDIANVSLVEGSVAVECQNEPYDEVLRKCQRYYERGFVGASGLSVGTTEGYLFVRFKTDKRVDPTISVIAGSSLASCISEIAVAERTPTSLIFETDINHVRIVTIGATYSTNGRLIVFRFDIIQADAEL